MTPDMALKITSAAQSAAGGAAAALQAALERLSGGVQVDLLVCYFYCLGTPFCKQASVLPACIHGLDK